MRHQSFYNTKPNKYEFKEKRQNVSSQFECLYTILRAQYRNTSDSETVLSLYTYFQIEVFTFALYSNKYAFYLVLFLTLRAGNNIKR